MRGKEGVVVLGAAKARAMCPVHWAEDRMGEVSVCLSVWARLKHLRRFHEKVSIPAERFRVDQPVRKTARETVSSVVFRKSPRT